MKVHEFWNMLPNKTEMRNKIKAFKEQKRRESYRAQFESCQACGSQVRFAHASQYLQNVIVEKACCTSCGQKAPDRKFSLN